MKRFRPFAFAAGGVAAALLVAVLPTLGTHGATGGTTAAVHVDAHLHELAQQPRPWTEFLASVGAAPKPASYDDRARREALVVDCMTSAGYRYVPMDWASIDAAIATARATLAPSSAALMAKYGFGVAAGIEGTLPSAKIGDPNAEVVAALDTAGRGAYGAARGRCNAQALAAIPDPQVAVVPAEVVEEVAALDRAAMRDPRVLAANAGWSDCMAKRGFQYADEASIVADLRAQSAPLRAAVGASGPTGTPTIPVRVQAQLDALAARELVVSAADLECKAPLDVVVAGVRNEYEAAYVAANGPRVSVLIVENRG